MGSPVLSITMSKTESGFGAASDYFRKKVLQDPSALTEELGPYFRSEFTYFCMDHNDNEPSQSDFTLGSR